MMETGGKSGTLDFAVQPTETKMGALEGLLRRALFAKMEQLKRGAVSVVESGSEKRFGDADDDLSARIRIHDSRFFSLTALGGSVGAAEAYMRGYWDCDDLTALIRILVRNQEVLNRVEGGMFRLTTALLRLAHRWRANSRSGSRRNISEHYDLGNDFFSLFLDETMTYSCGIFERESSSLAEAARAKYDRICRKLRLGSSDHVLEIGTGWGGFALHAALNYGCRVTTTTISAEQHEWASRLVRDKGLSDCVTVLLEDYRDLRGRYDKLVSIEMIEAVGDRYLDTYFEKCSSLLGPDGLMALQAITIADRHWKRSRRSVDFIQRYIFPGSALPSVSQICGSLARISDLRPFHLEDLTPHYPKTLRHWRKRFFSNVDQVRALGYSEAFIRMWEFYLCYCEGGFMENHIGNIQMILAKAGFRSETSVP